MFVTRLFGKEYRIKIIRTPPNKIFMFLTPQWKMLKYKKLIAKHIFEKFEKIKEEDGKK